MAAQNCNRSLPFLVFPSLNPVMFWRVVAVETNRTISNHKNLELAVDKAALLNVSALETSSDRGHCQDIDCYELADVSETRTSLAFCYRHYWDRASAFSFMLRRQTRGDI